MKTMSGIDWAYDVTGEGPVLLFLHGWSVDRRIWRQQMKFFSKKYKVILVDLPGHGQSTWQNICLDQMALDLIELLRRLAIRRVHVIGSSLGGLVGLKMYQMYASAIESLVMVGSLPKFAKGEDFPYGLGSEQFRKLEQQVDVDYPAILNIFFRSLFTQEERMSRRFKWIQRFRRENNYANQPALATYLDMLATEDLREILRSIHIPMLFLNGDGDSICPAEAKEYIQTLSPQVQYSLMKGKGHFPFLIDPNLFNKELEVFLGKVAV